MIDSGTVKELLIRKGAAVSGVASVERFSGAPPGFHPRDIFPECQSVAVFGVRFPAGVARAKTNAPYTLIRNLLITQCDTISVELTRELEEQGIAAVPIPSAVPYEYWDEKERHGRGILSLKHAAVLAGLGIMGKNTLLLNEDYGNMLWLGALLLAVPLEQDPFVEISLCPEGCQVCLTNCPQQALNGVTINQKSCREAMNRFSEGGEYIIACNRCRVLCPQFLGKRNKIN